MQHTRYVAILAQDSFAGLGLESFSSSRIMKQAVQAFSGVGRRLGGSPVRATGASATGPTTDASGIADTTVASGTGPTMVASGIDNTTVASGTGPAMVASCIVGTMVATGIADTMVASGIDNTMVASGIDDTSVARGMGSFVLQDSPGRASRLVGAPLDSLVPTTYDGLMEPITPETRAMMQSKCDEYRTMAASCIRKLPSDNKLREELDGIVMQATMMMCGECSWTQLIDMSDQLHELWTQLIDMNNRDSVIVVDSADEAGEEEAMLPFAFSRLVQDPQEEESLQEGTSSEDSWAELFDSQEAQAGSEGDMDAKETRKLMCDISPDPPTLVPVKDELSTVPPSDYDVEAMSHTLALVLEGYEPHTPAEPATNAAEPAAKAAPTGRANRKQIVPTSAEEPKPTPAAAEEPASKKAARAGRKPKEPTPAEEPTPKKAAGRKRKEPTPAVEPAPKNAARAKGAANKSVAAVIGDNTPLSNMQHRQQTC